VAKSSEICLHNQDMGSKICASVYYAQCLIFLPFFFVSMFLLISRQFYRLKTNYVLLYITPPLFLRNKYRANYHRENRRYPTVGCTTEKNRYRRININNYSTSLASPRLFSWATCLRMEHLHPLRMQHRKVSVRDWAIP